jgi:hypothetical protein
MFNILCQFSLLADAKPEPSYHDIMAMNALDGHPFIAPPSCQGSTCTGGGLHNEEGARKVNKQPARSARALMNMIDAGKLK